MLDPTRNQIAALAINAIKINVLAFRSYTLCHSEPSLFDVVEGGCRDQLDRSIVKAQCAIHVEPSDLPGLRTKLSEATDGYV